MRAGGGNNLLERLAADPRLGLSREQLDAALTDPIVLTGSARHQVDVIAARVSELARQFPKGAAYRPGTVL
jgi:adenylosuccinate lyase